MAKLGSPKAPKSNPRVPFQTGQRQGTTQTGVDPNTLKLGRPLLPAKVDACAAKISKEGMYGIIDVTSQGVVLGGNHRVDYSCKNGLTVDIYIQKFTGR